MKYTIDSEVLDDVTEMIEDTVSYLCDEYMISGELAWVIVESLAVSKQKQIKGEVR